MIRRYWPLAYFTLVSVGLVALLALALLPGCAKDPTGPTPVAAPDAKAGASSEGSVAELATGLAVRWYPLAGFAVTNTAGTTQYLEAFTTTFSAPATKLARKTATVANGSTWTDSFASACVQLDLAYQGGTIFAHAYYDKAGKVFGPGTNPEKVTECDPKPTPTPRPSPTPTPAPICAPNGDGIVVCDCARWWKQVPLPACHVGEPCWACGA